MKRLLVLVFFLPLSCADEESAPLPSPHFEFPSVHILPGTLITVAILGGIPPYHIIKHPDTAVVVVSLVDSTKSPSTLVITCPSHARIADTTSVVVDDSNPLDHVVATIVIQVVDDGLSYSGNIQPIWDVYCRNRGCHPGGGSPYSLEESVSYNNLFFSLATNQSCGARFRVYPFEPDSSLLYLLITGKASSCPRMPFSQVPGDTLPSLYQYNIQIWILEGALNN
jgi:hypothetical protein